MSGNHKVDTSLAILDQVNLSAGALLDALRISAAPAQVLSEVQRTLQSALGLLQGHERPGPHSQSGDDTRGFHERMLAPRDVMPYSPVIGHLNPVSPRLRFEVEGNRIVGHGRIPVRFVGAPQTVHGGIVAMVLDELMGLVNFVNGEGAFTGTMTVRYHRRTPIERDLELLGETLGVDGRKISCRAEILCDGEVTASAEGLFIKPRQTEG